MIKGEYVIILRDKRLKELKRFMFKNVVTTNALANIANAFNGLVFFQSMPPNPSFVSGCPSIIRKYWYIVLGTGSGSPSPSDTNLFNPIDLTAKHGSINVNNNQVTYWVRYLPEEANGYTYTEAGLFDIVSGSWVSIKPGQYVWQWGNYYDGVLLTHVMFPQSVVKTGTILLDVYAIITIG